MLSASIVAVEPARECVQAFGVGAVGAGVGPLVLQGLDEALRLPVGLRVVGPRVEQTHISSVGCGAEAEGHGVGLRVVGEHAAHANPAGAEVGQRALQEGGAARSALVGQGQMGVTV